MGDEQELLVKVAADSAKAVEELQRLNKGLGSVGDTAARTARQMQEAERAGAALGKVLAGAVVAGVGAAATALTTLGYASLRAAREFANWQEQIRNTGQQLGVTTDFVQALQSKLSDLGLGVGAAKTSVQQFSNVIQQARERGSDLGQLFRRLKVDLTDGDGKLRATEVIFTETARALGRMEDGATKTAAAKRLLGKQGALLLPLFNDLAKGTGDWVDQMREAGQLIDRDLLDAGRRLDDQLDAISTAGDVLKRTFGALASEAITPLAKGIAGDLQRGLKWLMENRSQVSDAIKTIADAFGGMYSKIRALTEEAIPPFLEALARIQQYRREREAEQDEWGEGFKEDPDDRRLREFLERRLAAARAGGAGSIEIASLERQLEEQVIASTRRGLGGRQNRRLYGYTNTDFVGPLAPAAGGGGSDDGFDPLAGLFGTGATGGIADKLRENLQAALDVLRDAANQQLQIEAELTQGKRAAMELRLQQTIETIEIERKQTIEEAERQLNGAQLTANELADINAAANARTEAARAEHAARMRQFDEQMKEARKDAIETISDLEVQAFGDAQLQAVYRLNQAQQDLIETLKELRQNQAITGEEFEALAERASRAYDKMRDEIGAVTIDIAGTLKQGIGDAFSGVILGTRNLGDVFKAFGQSMVSQFSQAFAEVLIKKAGFDTVFKLNMTRDLPAWSAEGAEGIANPILSVLDLLSGGSGVSRGIDVSPSGIASLVGGSTGSVSSALTIASSPLAAAFSPGAPSRAGGGGLFNLSNLSSVASLSGASPGSLLGGSGGGLFGGGSIFGPTVGAQGGLFNAVLGIGPGGGGLLGGAQSLLGGAGSLLGFAAPSLAGMLGLGGAAVTAPSLAAGLGTTAAFEAAMGAPAAAAGAAGGIGAAASGGILAGIIAGAIGIMAGNKYRKGTPSQRRQAGLSVGDPVVVGLGEMLGLNFEETEIISGVLSGGVSNVAMALLGKNIFKPPTAEGLIGRGFSDIMGLGAGIPKPWTAGGRSNGGPSSHAYTGSRDLYFPQVPLPASYADINRSPFAAIGGLLFGDYVPNSRDSGTSAGEYALKRGPAQMLLNQAAALGLNREGALGLGRKFTAAAFGDFEKGLLELRKEERESAAGGRDQLKFDSDAKRMEWFVLGVEQLISSFYQLSPAVDAARLATLALAADGTLGIEALQRMIAGAEQASQSLDIGGTLRGALSGGAGARAFRLDLRRNAQGAAMDAVFGGLGESDALGKPFGAFTATVAEAGEAFRAGDLARGNSLIARARSEYEQATDAAGAYFNKIKAEAPQVVAMLREIAAETTAIEIANVGLSDAINALVDSLSEAGEETRRQAELEGVLTEKRIKALEVSIEQAKAWGDEVSAAQFEMERQGIMASQDAERQARDPINVFVKAIQQQMQEQVVGAVVNGLLEAGAVQAVIQPVLEAIFSAGEVLANPNATPDEIAAVFQNIDSKASMAGPALKSITDNLASLFAVLGQSGVLDFAGLNVAKPMAAGGIVTSPTLALIGEAGPEAVIPLSRAGGNSFAPTINVSVQLNGTLDEYSAAMFADKIADISMNRLKANRLVGYN